MYVCEVWGVLVCIYVCMWCGGVCCVCMCVVWVCAVMCVLSVLNQGLTLASQVHSGELCSQPPQLPATLPSHCANARITDVQRRLGFLCGFRD